MELLRWIYIFSPANFLASRHVWVIPHAHAPPNIGPRTVFLSRGEEENGREEMMHRGEVARLHTPFEISFDF